MESGKKLFRPQPIFFQAGSYIPARVQGKPQGKRIKIPHKYY
jgi:hypothetical protein